MKEYVKCSNVFYENITPQQEYLILDRIGNREYIIKNDDGNRESYPVDLFYAPYWKYEITNEEILYLAKTNKEAETILEKMYPELFPEDLSITMQPNINNIFLDNDSHDYLLGLDKNNYKRFVLGAFLIGR